MKLRAPYLTFFKLAIVALFGLLVIRLYIVQVLCGDYYDVLGKKNYTRSRFVAPLRGIVYDCNHIPIATNKPMYDLLFVSRGAMTNKERDKLEEIAIALCIDDAIIQSARMARANKKVLLAKNLSLTEVALISELQQYMPQLEIVERLSRFYPYGHIASHALGYIGMVGPCVSQGKVGIEHVFNDLLKGHPGCTSVMVDARGNTQAETIMRKAHSGEALLSTLDMELCELADLCFPAGEKGCILIMEADTGALRVALSFPAFDPHIFLKPLQHDTWNEYVQSGALLNRYSQACYPPASLFKMVTLAAALDMGIFAKDQIWNCTGKTTFYNRDYHCSNRHGHGEMTIPLALAASCNIPFFEAAKRLKVDTIAQYAYDLGLGKVTGSILYEQEGLIPNASWKKRLYKEAWWPGETLSVAIGQGALLVTPLQILQLMHSLMYGYYVNPRLLLDYEKPVLSPVKLGESTRDFLKQCMHKTVDKRGTAVALRQLPDMDIYAKTGTAQVSSYELRTQGKEYLEHAWFAAHIRYKKHQPFIMVILIEHVGSSRIAAEVALRYLKKYATIMDARIIA